MKKDIYIEVLYIDYIEHVNKSDNKQIQHCGYPWFISRKVLAMKITHCTNNES